MDESTDNGVIDQGKSAETHLIGEVDIAEKLQQLTQRKNIVVIVVPLGGRIEREFGRERNAVKLSYNRQENRFAVDVGEKFANETDKFRFAADDVEKILVSPRKLKKY